MEDHEQWALLSAFVDDELTQLERSAVSGHLAGCSSCRDEVADLRRVKLLASSAPRRAMPPDLLADLEGRFEKPSWADRARSWAHAIRSLAVLPRVAVPVGVSAVAVLVAGLWFGYRASLPPDDLPVDLLLAAHSRYSAGSMVPGGDLTAVEFSGHLADYHETR